MHVSDEVSIFIWVLSLLHHGQAQGDDRMSSILFISSFTSIKDEQFDVLRFLEQMLEITIDN